jgi:PAS domain-containing protein
MNSVASFPLTGAQRTDMSPIEQVLRDCGIAAGIGYWRFDAARGMLHWPRGFGPARDESYGSWWRLGEFGQAFDPADRARLFDYFENLFEAEWPNKPLELPIATSAGRIPLRIEGAPLSGVDQLLAGGLVRNVSRRHEAEDRARALGQILDAVLASVAAGVVVLDAHLHVRKANARALQFFGLEPREGEEAAALAVLGARLPIRLGDDLRASQMGRTASSGALAAGEGLAEPVTWTANPWGRGGLVIVLRIAAAADAPVATPAPLTPPDQNALVAAAVARARALLDYVHHPCLVIQSRDASIDFANKAAREKLALKPGLRTHINNLFEISGRHAPRHTYVTADRVTAVVTLPMGARVARMVDVDPDWLFVEYV